MGKLLPNVWPTLAANLSIKSFNVSLLLRVHKVGTSIATLNAHANPTDEVVFAANKATFFNSDESISMPHLQQWQRDLHQLRRQLMLLVHLWAGQPGRALETTALRFADSQTQARNVFIAGGDVVIITSTRRPAERAQSGTSTIIKGGRP